MLALYYTATVKFIIILDSYSGPFHTDVILFNGNNWRGPLHCSLSHNQLPHALTHNDEDSNAYSTLVWTRLQVKAHSCPSWTGTTQKPWVCSSKAMYKHTRAHTTHDHTCAAYTHKLTHTSTEWVSESERTSPVLPSAHCWSTWSNMKRHPGSWPWREQWRNEGGAPETSLSSLLPSGTQA